MDKKVNQNLQSFLKNHIVSKDDNQFTHTSIIGGKWFIDDNELDIFYRLYIDEYEQGNELHITEKHNDKYGQLVIDLDFKYNSDQKKSAITDIIISKIVNNITNILKTNLDSTNNFTCFALKRPVLYVDKKTGYLKDGLHLQFPYIITKYEFHHAVRNKYLKIMHDDIKDIPFIQEKENIDKQLESIYDKSVIEKNNWFIYGSTKKDIPPYQIIKIYNCKGKQLQVLKSMQIFEIIKLLSIRRIGELSIANNKYNELIEEYINDTINKSSTNVKTINKLIKHDHDNNHEHINENIEYDDNQIIRLLNILSTERRDDYDKWINIGILLFNCSKSYGNDDIDFLRLWKDWSRKSPKYESGCCERFWKTFIYKENGIKLPSLYYYARKDNPDEYKKLFVENVIMDNNNNFMNEELKILSVTKDIQGYNALLLNTVCPFIGKSHRKPKLYINTTENGMVLRCRSTKCFGKTHPLENYINITPKQKEVLFINYVNNTTINNYNSCNVDNIIIYDEFNENFEEDMELNKLINKSLSGTPCDMADLIYYKYKDKYILLKRVYGTNIKIIDG